MKRYKVFQIIIGLITCLIILVLSKTESSAQSFKVDRIGKRKQTVILIQSASIRDGIMPANNFLMYDDPKWFLENISKFLKQPKL